MASKSPSNYHHNHQHKHNQLQQMPNGSSSLTPVEQLFRHFDSMSEAELREQLARENLDTRGTTRQLLMRLRQHYRTALVEIRKRCPNRARTANFYDYFVVIDFECSCDKDNYDYEHEIIEFPAVLVGVQTRKIVDTFHTFVRPTGNPRLTEFCTNLTGITQETVDRSPEFPQALDAFRRWLTAHGLDGEAPRGSEASRFCYVTDGPWDIGKFLQMQCLRSAIPIPHDFRPFLNIRRAFVNFYCHGRPGHEAQARMPSTDLCSLLQRLGMQFEGREHSGMDDALNIARVLLQMLEDRAELRVNEKLVRGTKLRDGQKLVFDDNTKAPCRPSPAAASATAASSSAASLLSESSSSNEEIVRAGMAASFAKKFSGSSSSVQAEEQNEDDDGGDVTVWKKWWDPLPYKLVKISRQEFLGEQHQECESCDDEGEEDEREEYEDEQW